MEQIHAYLFSAAFTIWMLVDAWRRHAPLHWFFIIVVMPFGSVIYFVMVKMRDYRENPGENPLASLTSSPMTPRAESPLAATPADLNQADALETRERYAEAEPLYRAVLATNPADKRALHGLGRCLLGSGRAAESLAHFEKLLELDREFANFGAALDYADALWENGQRHDTIELLERIAEMTNRINHRLALGHYLAESGQVERAVREIERAIEDARTPAAPFNERQRRWVERGREMLTELSSRAEPSKPSPTDVN